LDLIANGHTLLARTHHHLLGRLTLLGNCHRHFSIVLRVVGAHGRLIFVFVVYVSTPVVEGSVGSREIGLILLVRKMGVGSSFAFSCSIIKVLLLLLTTLGYLSSLIKDPIRVIAVQAHVMYTHGLLIRKHRLSAFLPLFAAIHHSII
jgi:hypothetical protein